MAKRLRFKQSIDERRRRVFSEDFKQKKVREIEQKITAIAEVSREYEAQVLQRKRIAYPIWPK